jgi:hypothetical protein
VKYARDGHFGADLPCPVIDMPVVFSAVPHPLRPSPDGLPTHEQG